MKTILKLLLLLFVLKVNAQVGINTTNPDTTLDIRAVNHNGAVSPTDGLLVPRVNSLSTSGTINGQLVYLIADAGGFIKGFHYWNNIAWTPLNVTSSGDTTNDAFINNTTSNSVELGTTSLNTVRLAGTQFIIYDDGKVNIGTNTPNTSALLNLESSNKGLLLTRVALTSTMLATPLASHVAGMVVYNTVTAGNSPTNVRPGLYINDGTKWEEYGKTTTITTNLGDVGGCNGITYTPSGNAITAPLSFTHTIGAVSAILVKTGTTTINGHSYAQYNVTSNGITLVTRPWNFLQNAAQQTGGYLVVPTTKAENDAIITYLNLPGNALNTGNQVPVGWRKSDNQNERYQPHRPITCEKVEYNTANTNPFSFYNFWSAGQPDYSAYCNYYQTNGLWDDEQCGTNRYSKILIEFNE